MKTFYSSLVNRRDVLTSVFGSSSSRMVWLTWWTVVSLLFAPLGMFAQLAGENCSNPVNLDAQSSPFNSTTVGYSSDMSTCRVSTGGDRVFRITVANGASLYLRNLVDYDAWEYMGYGSDCSSNTQIQCWDNDSRNAIEWTNNTGSTQTVWYILDAYSSGSGTFSLSWSITGGAPSAPTSVSVSNNNFCPGTSTRLTANGAVGTVYWYTGGCGSTQVGTGSYLDVSPSSTTTYYARNYNNSQYSSSCASATVTVNPATPSTPSSASVSSITATTASISWSSSSQTTTYYWVVGTSSSVSYGTGSWYGTTAATSASVSGLSANTTYYLRVYANNSCGSSGYVTSSAFTTLPPNPTSISASVSTICSGSSTSLTANGAVGTVYWYTSACGGTLVTTGNPINVSPTSSTTYYARNYATSQYSSGCASTTITVNSASVGGTVAGSTTVCAGTNSTTLTLSGHTGSVTKWQYSTAADFSVALTDVASTSTSLVVTNLSTTRYYRAVLTNGVCASANSASATITVNPVSVAGSVSGATTVCSGTNSTTLTLTGHTGTVQWQSSPNNSTFTNISGATASTYAATNLTTTTYYRAAVTNGVCAAANTSSATITVNATPSVASITGTPSVCVGLTTQLANTTAAGVWSSASPSVATISAVGVVTGVSAGTSEIRYTVTSALGCVGVSTATVTVAARLAAPTASAASDTIVTGSSTTLTASGVGSNITWYNAASGGSVLMNTANGATYSVSPTTTTTYYAEANSTASFYINSLSTTNSAVVEHNSYTGDDCGGIAVTSSYYYYTGDNNTVRYTMPGLTNPTSCTKRDGLFSDLGTGTLYTLWNGSSAPTYNNSSFTVTHFRTLNSDLGLGSTYVTLSSALTLSSGVAIYAGSGFVILQSGSSFSRVDIPSGTVTAMGSYSISRYTSESWATWGVAEKNGSVYSILYRTASAHTINRLNLSNGDVSTLASFTNLGDMAAFTYSPWHNRWYFHYEGSGQFGGTTETAGYADGTHTSTSDGCPSASRTAVRVVVITLPTVTTASITNNAGTSAAGGGEVTNSGGAPVTARGVCWSTSQNPTTANSKTTDGTGTGSFSSSITGLSAGTLYYVRAYAITRAGTSYGTQVNVTAASAGIIAGRQTVCKEGIPTAFTSTSAASSMPSVVYTWQMSSDSISFTDLPNSNSTTYQAGTIEEKTYFRRKAVSGSVTLYSNTISVSVDAGAVVPTSVTATPATISSGQSSNLQATVPAGNQVKWFNAATSGTLLQTINSATNYAVSPTSTTTYYAETSPINCTNNSLSSILSNLNTNYTNITSQIPGRYTFSMDGSGGVNANQISDGGNDMYDGGNLLSTNLASQFTYSDNTVKTTGSIFGTNGKFFTRYVSGLFVLAADLHNVSSFSVYGNYGSDGGGSRDNGSFTITVGCQTFQVYVARVYNANDPSINEMFIVPSVAGLSFTPLANTSASTSTLSGLGGSTRLYYLLYAGSTGGYINNASAESIAIAFLNQTSATVAGASACPSSERVPVTVTVSASPTITTAAITNLGATAATAGGTVSSDGGAAITARGVCWSTSVTPTIANNKITVSGTTGAFTGEVTGLSTGTTYYLRAYATNAMGTSYGSQVSFTPYQLGSFGNLNKVYGDAPFTLIAPSSASSGAFSYASSNESVATISGSTVTIVGVGTTTITASQAASGIYGAASKTCLLTVTKANQIITLSPLPTSVPLNQFVGNLLVSASASSGLPVTVSLGSGSAATLIAESNNYYLTSIGSTGSVTIVVDQAGNANFNPAQISQSFDVTKGNQTITFQSLDPVTYGTTSTVNLSATATSGPAVSFTVLSGSASVTGSTLTLAGAGLVVVEASQPGNSSWNPATSVQQVLTVSKATPVILFSNINKQYGDAAFDLSASSASTGAFSYTSSQNSVATINGATATVTGAGVTTLTATQAATDNYEAASAEATLTVGTAVQEITMDALADIELLVFEGSPITLSAASSSALPVTFTVEAGSVATLNNGNELVSTGATGTVMITVTQAGNDNFEPAVYRDTFAVTKTSQVITFAPLGSVHLSDPAFDVDVSASSDLLVTLSSSNPAVATVSNKTITIVGVGTTTITATQSGNTYYAAASSVARELEVLADVFNTWTGAVSTDWFLAANWSNNSVPDATTDVVIPDVTNQPAITSATATCAALTIQANATMSVSLPGQLAVYGAITNAGYVSASTGTVAFNGINPQVIPSTFFLGNSVYGLTINNASGVSLSDELNITGVLTVTTGTFSTQDHLTLKSTMSGTARVAAIGSGGLIEGQVMVERYIPAHESRAWRLLSVPTYGNGQTIRQAWQEGDANPNAMDNNLSGYGTIITTNGTNVEGAGFDEASTTPSMYTYGGSEWIGVPSTLDPIASTQAYFLYIRGDRSVTVNTQVTNNNTPTTLRTRGTLYQGDVTVDATGDFTAIGNVYASPIDFTQLTRSGAVMNRFYVWDAKKVTGTSLGAYQTFCTTNSFQCLLDGGSFVLGAANKVIQSGQGFFVQGAGTVTFHESAKVSSNSLAGLRPANELVKIDSRLYTNVGANRVMMDANVVVFDNQYTATVDAHDAPKMSNNGENFAIGVAGQYLAIEGRSALTQADTIFFRLWNLRRQTYQFDIVPQNLTGIGFTAFLRDKYRNTSTPVNLQATTTVSFTVDANAASAAQDRFYLVFQPTAPVPVTLVSVAANRQPEGVQVDWIVAAEQDLARYEVQRSLDGTRFETVTQVPVTSSGLSAQKVYTWMDRQAPDQTLFYRIKPVDRDGHFRYSSIVKVNTGLSRSGWTVAPNPVTDGQANLQLQRQQAGRYLVRLVTAVGQTVYQQVIEHAGGSANYGLVFPNRMVRGTYQLQLISPDKQVQSQSLLIHPY